MSPQRSSIATEAGEAVLHYKRKLTRHLEDESPDIVLHCLDKLELIPVNIHILQETGIGKVVNHLKKSESADESVIDKARAIVSKWKEIVANEEQALSQQNETEEDQPDEKSDEQVKNLHNMVKFINISTNMINGLAYSIQHLNKYPTHSEVITPSLLTICRLQH